VRGRRARRAAARWERCGELGACWAVRREGNGRTAGGGPGGRTAARGVRRQGGRREAGRAQGARRRGHGDRAWAQGRGCA
jgi:hypothetical protein